MGKKVFCTANAANYLSRALTFAESVKEIYGDEAIVVCCLVERSIDFIDTTKYEMVDLFLDVFDIGIPDFDRLAFEHNLLEMSCFVRPFLMETVFGKYPDAEIYYYMDCDTWLYSKLEETDWALTEGKYNIALTPHSVDPPDYEFPEGERIHERAILRHGTFNLGFLGIVNRPYAKDIITKWWKDRLLSSCFWDICEGVFVDQKWWNPVPYMFDGIYVETSRGYNYASWTIMRRTIEKKGEEYLINGDRLRFGHFSATFNGHVGYAPVYGIEDRNQMLRTLEEYCEGYYKKVEEFDFPGYSKVEWSLGNYQNGYEISDRARTAYRKNLKNWLDETENPYSLSNEKLLRLSGDKDLGLNNRKRATSRVHKHAKSNMPGIRKISNLISRTKGKIKRFLGRKMVSYLQKWSTEIKSENE
jgi:hypothetical protein